MILVVGNRGFIGSHLHAYYRQRFGDEVWGCDVVTDYGAKNYFLIDAINAQFDELFAKHRFNTVINCSGASSVQESLINPMRDYYLNTKYVFDILQALKRHNSECKFINLSSAAVYGNPQEIPIRESLAVQPLSPYGWHKYQSEVICREFNEIFGIRTVSARIFSAYGDGLKKQLFWDWSQKLQTSSHIVLHGTGNESRDFIFIDDIVQAISCIVERAAFRAEVINVANGVEIFIKDAIRIFQEEYGRDFSYRFNNVVRPGDPINWRADISNLRSLGYSQKVEFKQGIKKYLKWVGERE